MAIKDTKRKPYIEDNDENIFIGIDLPFRKSDGVEGYFASTSTTIEAVKNNIRNLLQTYEGERLYQPNLGIGLRKFTFEQLTEESTYSIQNTILDKLKVWLPFVEIRDIKIKQEDNTLRLSIVFNITQDPNTLESVSIEIGE
jgi:phage baseplate assembly protein W